MTIESGDDKESEASSIIKVKYKNRWLYKVSNYKYIRRKYVGKYEKCKEDLPDYNVVFETKTQKKKLPKTKTKTQNKKYKCLYIKHP